MKIMVSVAAWGRKYAATFSQYSLASQLSPNNIPKIVEKHDLTYHIVTTGEDRDSLRRQPTIKLLEGYCDILWNLIEAQGIDLKQVPAESDDKKYSFLSRLQNLAFAKSQDYDAIVFNYADFVWADGSLANSIAMLDDDVDAVLSFCLPVDRSSGIRSLNRSKANGQVLNVSTNDLARIAIDNLHRDARLRYWDGPSFTAYPTYVLWKVEPDGILIRAYHQTVLVLRVDHDDPQFRFGIPRGSLDGHFSSNLAASARIVHATDSNEVMVFSLHDSAVSTSLRARNREEALRESLRIIVSKDQRLLAEAPIRVRSQLTNPEEWQNIERESWAALHALHETTSFDQGAYDDLHSQGGDLQSALRQHTVSDFVYRRVLLRLARGPLGVAFKKLFGNSARRLRLAIERRVYGPKE